MINKFWIHLSLLFILAGSLNAQQKAFRFAYLTDTHISKEGTSIEDLERSVRDINEDTTLAFVIVTGDVSNFGSDWEIAKAHAILKKLTKPFYAIPGNHDANWSESGANSFKTIFGSETIAFHYGGYLFIGTASGPSMRMAPGQVPMENLRWMDSTLNSKNNRKLPLIFLNHYPISSELNNWYEITQRLHNYDTRLILGGHWHTDAVNNYEDIPGIIARSNLRAQEDTGGYNIVTIQGDTAYFQDRKPGGRTLPVWAKAYIGKHVFKPDSDYPRPDYSVNKKYSQVKELWRIQNQSDIGSGLAIYRDLVYSTDSRGYIHALNIRNGKIKWIYATKGKIYATPAISKDGILIVSSTDRYIYALNAINGKLLWKLKTKKANVACPLIENQLIYIGGSDSIFRCINLRNGKENWTFNKVAGFVVDRPLIYRNKIYFGCWGNDFYCLNAQNGKLIWKWNRGSGSAMFSPAACYPVGANRRIFIVAPDRYMTAFDAETGNIIWRKKEDSIKVRESMGLSLDSSMVYAKTMDGDVLGFSVKGSEMKIVWRNELRLGYEICPTPLTEFEGQVFVPSQSGIVSAIDRKTGLVSWQHKLSNCTITGLLPLKGHCILACTMDGIISMMHY